MLLAVNGGSHGGFRTRLLPSFGDYVSVVRNADHVEDERDPAITHDRRPGITVGVL